MARKHRSAALFVALLLALGSALSAHQIDGDGMTLVIHEDIGRFSLYDTTQGGEPRPLLEATDPRTTVLTVVAGNRVYRMGDAFEFRQRVTTYPDGAEMEWSYARLVVRQRFTMERDASGAPLLRVKVSAENNAQAPIDVGFRFLLDTFLGETTSHFRIGRADITGETEIIGAPTEPLVSASEDGTRLYIGFAAQESSVPTRIVLANWKRLSDTPWRYEVNRNRDFSLRPYSLNDSAVALYFDPEEVPSSTIRSVTFTLAANPPSVVTPAAVEAPAAPPESTASIETDPLLASVLDDLAAVDAIIDRITAMIATDGPRTDDDLRRIAALLDELERRAQSQHRR